MQPSLGPHDRTPPATPDVIPLPGALAMSLLSRPPAFPLDSPLRNPAWPRGLTLSTFSHPKSEAPGTAVREGAMVGSCPSRL